MRNTIEKIEKIGIKRSIEQIAKSDLIIHVVDPTQEDDEYDELIASEAKKKWNFILKVYNKSDLIKPKILMEYMFRRWIAILKNLRML
ncbi:tRNA modification GTPase TrmE (plasmid) [Mycoplasmopsis cynos]|uniref:tRNA modification GTPase TrmE n=1 Tax=Mycoplasmopsis cynos TaxID=171284 RepID=A0A449AJH5_9BACT|nr:hypothetical protein [Mycoplasmopsis cynos]VEU65129.1 tRNA modification GTPase TrmE [Mycoplasmopsis cynos]